MAVVPLQFSSQCGEHVLCLNEVQDVAFYLDIPAEVKFDKNKLKTAGLIFDL